MKNEQIIHAMQHIDPQLIEEAARPAASRGRRIRTALLAACLCLVVAVPVMAAAGNLLVKHSYGSSLPEHLADRELDAYYEFVNTHRLPISDVSQAVLDTAKNQTTYGFQTWDAMEAYLGINILDNTILTDAVPHPVELTNSEGQILQNVPCTLALSCGPEGELHAIHADYFCMTQDDTLLSVTASALTELSPDDSAGSLAVDYGNQHVRSQTSETYLTASGAEATIISTRLSGSDNWGMDGWILQNGFVVRISLFTSDEAAAKSTICQVMDAFCPS